jgi:hypothetical protein
MTRQTVVHDAQFAVWKVIDEVQAVGAGAALVVRTLRNRRLEIGNGVIPELPGGIGTAPLVVVPPALTPGSAGGDAVLFAVPDVDRAALDGTPRDDE